MNEPVTVPAYTLPTRPVPKTGKVLLISIVAILVLLAGAAAYVYFSYVQDFAFRGTRYLAGTFEERALYELNWLGDAKEVSLPVAGRVIDYDRSSDVEAAILLSDAGQQVYLLDADASRVLAGGQGIRSSLSVSPDGASVAYAERTGKGTETAPSAFYNPAFWEIHVVNVSTGENVVIGSGYAPQLFERDGESYVLYSTNAGVRIRALSSTTEQELLLDLGDARGVFPAMVTEDGRLLALPSPVGAYVLYTLTHEGGTFVLREQGFAPAGATSIAFDGQELVSLNHATDTMYLIRSRLALSEEPTVTKSVPVQFITKLIP